VRAQAEYDALKAKVDAEGGRSANIYLQDRFAGAAQRLAHLRSIEGAVTGDFGAGAGRGDGSIQLAAIARERELQEAAKRLEESRITFMAQYRNNDQKLADALADYRAKFAGRVDAARQTVDEAAIRARFADKPGAPGKPEPIAEDWRTEWGRHLSMLSGKWNQEIDKQFGQWEQEAAQADQRRLAAAGEFSQRLTDESRRAAAEMIDDERTRANAVIDIERDLLQRQLDAIGVRGQAYDDALAALQRKVADDRARVDQRITRDEKQKNEERSKALSDSIAEGLLDGFRRGGSFADVFLNELKAQFAKTVLSPIIRPMVEAGNAGIGDLLGLVLKGLGMSGGSVSGLPSGADAGLFWDMGPPPRLAAGGPALPGKTYVIGEQGPELLQMGALGGQVIPNHQLRQAGGTTVQLSYAPTIRIDSRSDQQQVAALVGGAVREGHQQMLQMLHDRGVLR
jgi:hypothetical protein